MSTALMTTSAATMVLTVTQLRKCYSQKAVLDKVSLQLAAGEVLAILGPNGAGKTTLINTILGLNAADSGEIHLFGQQQKKLQRSLTIRQQLGVMMQVGQAGVNLTVTEQCDLFSSYYPAGKTVAELLFIAGLQQDANSRFGRLSGGQKQRLLFALALAGNPRLVFLDEPTLGMDVQARRALWQQIRQIKAAGVAVVLTTHYLEEAEQLADRVALLQHGRVIAEDTPAGLKSLIKHKKVRCICALADHTLLALPGVTQLERMAQYCVLTTQAAELTVRALLDAAPALTELEVTPVALEQVFLQLTAATEYSL